MPANAEPEAARDPSDSAIQREIEAAMLGRLGKAHPEWKHVSWKTEAEQLGLSVVWQRAQPDATWRSGSGQLVVAECYARVGELKAGHRRKLAMDTLKLSALRRVLPESKHRFLLVVPEDLEISSGGWLREAIDLVAEVVAVKLSESELGKLRQTMALQAQGQSRTARPKRDRNT